MGFQGLTPYLQGHKFTLYTEHKPSKRILNLADASGRLARWRLRLLEFDFDVKYSKGSQNHIADTLSCLPCAMDRLPASPIDDEIPCFSIERYAGIDAANENLQRVEEESLDSLPLASNSGTRSNDGEVVPVMGEEIVSEQARDAFCKEMASRVASGEKCSYFFDASGILIRRSALDESVQYVVPKSLQSRILYLAHYPISPPIQEGVKFSTHCERDIIGHLCLWTHTTPSAPLYCVQRTALIYDDIAQI